MSRDRKAVVILAEIALFTPRVAEVAAFYARLFRAIPVHATVGKAIFVIDGVHVMVHDGSAPTPHAGPIFDEEGYPPDKDHVAFHVDDLDAAVADLRGHGMAVEVGDFPWGRSAYLLDPDGRLVELQAGNGAASGYRDSG